MISSPFLQPDSCIYLLTVEYALPHYWFLIWCDIAGSPGWLSISGFWFRMLWLQSKKPSTGQRVMCLCAHQTDGHLWCQTLVWEEKKELEFTHSSKPNDWRELLFFLAKLTASIHLGIGLVPLQYGYSGAILFMWFCYNWWNGCAQFYPSDWYFQLMDPK